MKIALVRQKYTPFGGAERFVTKALEALSANQSVEVSLLTRQWKGEAALGDAAVRVVSLNPFSLGRTCRDKRFARAVQSFLETESFDLVQSHERIAGCDVYRAGDGVHRVWLERKNLGQPIWRRWLDSLNPYHRYIVSAERQMFQSDRLKAVICNSRMIQQEIHQRFDLPLSKLPVIYSAVNGSQFNPSVRDHKQTVRDSLGIPATAYVLLFVGSGFARKGVLPILQALQRLPDEVYAVFVGKDKQQATFEKEASKRGVARRVRFVGAQMEVKPYYGMADVFVLPTLYDAFPNVTLEAFACGLPVITSQYCGAAELIKEGGNGAVVDPFDIKALVSSILAFKANPPKLDDVIETVANLTPETMAAEMLSLYRRVLSSPSTEQIG